MGGRSQVEGADVTPFVAKLWNMLEDPSLCEVVSWDESGLSFHIYDIHIFSRAVLCRFFKSSAFTSFIRQLNLYGFKKLSETSQHFGQHHTEFSHPYFAKGRWELLPYITRKLSPPKKSSICGEDVCTVMALENGEQEDEELEAHPKTEEKLLMVSECDLTTLVTELRALRVSHSALQNTVSELAKDKEIMRSELTLLRSSHSKQQKSVNQLVQFLLSLVQSAQQAPTSRHHHHAKQSRVGTGGISHQMAQLEPPVEENPLALVGCPSNGEVLEAIQSDLLMEELDSLNRSLNPVPLTDVLGVFGHIGHNGIAHLPAEVSSSSTNGGFNLHAANPECSLRKRPMPNHGQATVPAYQPPGQIDRAHQQQYQQELSPTPCNSLSLVHKETAVQRWTPRLYEQLDYARPVHKIVHMTPDNCADDEMGQSSFAVQSEGHSVQKMFVMPENQFNDSEEGEEPFLLLSDDLPTEEEFHEEELLAADDADIELDEGSVYHANT